MKKLSFHFTDKQFTALAHHMHELLLQNYIETSQLRVLEAGIFNQRIAILILWELYLRIAKRSILKKQKYVLYITEVEGMAFFGYFNSLTSQLDIYESAIFQLICDRVYQSIC